MIRLGCAIIPSNNRECLKLSIDAILPQVHCVLIVQTGGEWTGTQEEVFVVRDPGTDKNISRWWNIGFSWAKVMAERNNCTQWDVAVINDDVIVPEGWFAAVAGTMRQMQVAAACSGGRGPMPVLHTQQQKVDIYTRMQGFAYVIAGEKDIRANEDIPWYFSDDAIENDARVAGGVVMIPGCHVEHMYPNGQMTADMQVLSANGGQVFIDKYGYHPFL